MLHGLELTVTASAAHASFGKGMHMTKPLHEGGTPVLATNIVNVAMLLWSDIDMAVILGSPLEFRDSCDLNGHIIYIYICISATRTAC